MRRSGPRGSPVLSVCGAARSVKMRCVKCGQTQGWSCEPGEGVLLAPSSLRKGTYVIDQRVGWGELPARTRRAVVQRFGVVSSARTVPEGITCRTALVLTTATKTVFLKGVPVSDRQGVAAQRMEVRVNEALRAVGPAVLWEAVAGGWHLVAFDHLDGRHADFAPGATDAGIVAEVLGRARRCQVPAGGGIPRLVERYEPRDAHTCRTTCAGRPVASGQRARRPRRAEAEVMPRAVARVRTPKSSSRCEGVPIRRPRRASTW